jgi:hypothetical protein
MANKMQSSINASFGFKIRIWLKLINKYLITMREVLEKIETPIARGLSRIFSKLKDYFIVIKYFISPLVLL